jgi:hypothetical protein
MPLSVVNAGKKGFPLLVPALQSGTREWFQNPGKGTMSLREEVIKKTGSTTTLS